MLTLPEKLVFTVLLIIQNFCLQVTMLLLIVGKICLHSKWCTGSNLNFINSKYAFICVRAECSRTLSVDSQLLNRVEATSALGVEVLSNLKLGSAHTQKIFPGGKYF